MEPLITLATGAIAKIAFDEFVKAGAGETAKKSIGGAIELVKSLRDRIRARFWLVTKLQFGNAAPGNSSFSGKLSQILHHA